MKMLMLAPVVLLAGCGSASALRPAPGKLLPPKPYGTTVAPDARQLLSPSNQARPERSDELLRNSDERRGDDFDLPPPN